MPHRFKPTQEQQIKFFYFLGIGAALEKAAILAKLSPRSVDYWLKRGRDGLEQPYGERSEYTQKCVGFLRRYEEITQDISADRELKSLSIINRACKYGDVEWRGAAKQLQIKTRKRPGWGFLLDGRYKQRAVTKERLAEYLDPDYDPRYDLGDLDDDHDLW